jgi:hypothetical protein
MSACQVLTEAWDLYSNHVRDRIGMANAAKNRGVAECRLSEFSEADRWLDLSLENYREIEDFLGIVRVRNDLGLIHLKLNDRERACAEFGKAMNLMDETRVENPLERARAYEGLGHCQIADAIRSLGKAKYGYSTIRADLPHARVVRTLDALRGHFDV